MNMLVLRRAFAIACAALLIAVSAQARALAQDTTPTPEPPPPACIPDEQTSCVQIVFSPSARVGDLFLVDAAAGEQPTTQVQQTSLWVTFTNPAQGMTTDVVVKNIHDGGANEGVLYVYPDIAKTVTSPTTANKTKKVTLTPVKQYIAGRVDAKCGPKSVAEGEDVSCVLTVDGTPAQPLAAGASISLFLSPGAHTLQFDLAGANAALWSPPSLVKTITVHAGPTTTPVTATFTKANHLLAKLSVDGWVGDFYLDGTLATPQAPALDTFVKGNASHKLEVKNIFLPGSPLIHPYYDGSRTFYAAANGTSNITVTLTKVPTSVMKTPTFGGGKPATLTTSTYVMWWPAWDAATAELAEESANHVWLVVTLDGVYIGDVTPYRAKAVLETQGDGSCGNPTWKPCYSVAWKIPLGKLAEGPHYLYAENVPFDVNVNIGWEIYPAGDWFYWDNNFSISPAP